MRVLLYNKSMSINQISSTSQLIKEPEQPSLAKLRQLILSNAILHSDPEQPFTAGNLSATEMLDSLLVTLTSDGLQLAAQCILEKLSNFRGCQLATYGTMGIPLMTAVIYASGGRYTGLIVRKEAKSYGSRKLIEGFIRKDEPIIIIDDSIHSGSSTLKCIQRLEQHGLYVEGGVFLFGFNWRMGRSVMAAKEFHTECILDVWQDLKSSDNHSLAYTHNSSLARCPQVLCENNQAADEQTIFQLIRSTITYYLDTGRCLKPPRILNGKGDSTGGIYISLRSRQQLHHRYARDGFWRFPEDESSHLALDIVLASYLVAQLIPSTEKGRQILEDSVIGVTLLGRLQECQVRDLDNDRFGIVVRSNAWQGWMGGALPNMPSIFNEGRQYNHARNNNAKLHPHEPMKLYRHTLSKHIESGTWLSGGSPNKNDSMQEMATQKVSEYLLCTLLRLEKNQFQPPENTTRPDLIYAKISLNGQGIYLTGNFATANDWGLNHLAETLFNNVPDGIILDECLVTVYLLYRVFTSTVATASSMGNFMIPGRQALQVTNNHKTGIVLPESAIHNGFTGKQCAELACQQAGIDNETPAYWQMFDCYMHAVGHNQSYPLSMSLPERLTDKVSINLDSQCQKLNLFTKRMARSDGGFFLYYQPFSDILSGKAESIRVAYAAWVQARTVNYSEDRGIVLDWVNELISYCAKQQCDSKNSLTNIAFTALASHVYSDVQEAILTVDLSPLWKSIDHYGRIQLEAHTLSGSSQDFVPGQILLALAQCSDDILTTEQQKKIESAIGFYASRFRHHPNCYQICWLGQAFSAWHKRDARTVPLHYLTELADWVLQFQLSKNGGFITNMQLDSPGFSSAVYLESIAAIALACALVGEQSKAQYYLGRCDQGFDFLNKLSLLDIDRSFVPNPDFAIGAIRCSEQNAIVHIDYITHSLSALQYALEAKAYLAGQ